MLINNYDIDGLEASCSKFVRDTKAVRLLSQFGLEEDPSSADVRMREIVAQLTPEEHAAFGNPEKRDGFYDLEVFLARNPHLFFALGYDEIRIEPKVGNEIMETFEERIGHRFFDEFGRKIVEVHFGLWCRSLKSGTWHRYGGIHDSEYAIRLFSDDGSDTSISFSEFVARCKSVILGDEHPAAMLLPRLWTPPSTASSISLVETTKQLIKRLADSRVTLDQIDWRDLEDIVAEVLHSKGLQVAVTDRASDGGRDVIARGELLPGEPITFAVEVKHSSVVGLDAVRSRLYANREFPMLMMATSGRFSAGVIKEKKRPENFLRLLLKDGKALKSWIDDYVKDVVS